MKKQIILNLATGLFGQLIVIILGMIVPRIFIIFYGSDLNGLLGTVTQVYTYVALFEAGIGQASKNALYRPILEGEKTRINSVLNISYSYFRRISLYYAIATIVFSIVAPLVINTNIDKMTVFLISFIEGLSGVVSFVFVQTYIVFLYAEGKNYVYNSVNYIYVIIIYLFKIFLATLGVDILVIQFLIFILSIVKIVCIRLYIFKRYKWINLQFSNRKVELKDRNAFVITELAWTVFSSTDMIIISIFLNTQLSSVYSIYNMVFSQISALLYVVYTSVVYLLAYSFHENIKKYEVVHDSFVSIFMCLITTLMTVCYLLTNQFVDLYTKNVTEINYVYTSLPFYFCLIQMLSWSRYVGGNLTGLSGYAKQTSYISIFEASINVILSIVLAKQMGVAGVLLATLISLPVKVIWCIYVSDKKVMKRSYFKTIRILGVNFLFFFFVVLLNRFFYVVLNSVGELIAWGLIISIFAFAINLLLNFWANKQCLFFLKNCKVIHK